MKLTFLAFISIFLWSCEAKPFINHTLHVEKISDDCAAKTNGIHVESNINGERYVFEYCLEEGFDVKNFTVQRNGDTLNAVFPKSTTGKQIVLHKLTLDIDANPPYHYIWLGEQVVQINPHQ